MKKKIKPFDLVSNILDDNPTDELPVLNEAALARIESVEASTIGDSDDDTGEHAALRLEDIAVTRSDWTTVDENPLLERLETDLRDLQQRWHSIEDELRERDIHAAKLEESLRARSMALEALDEELQAANRARVELERAGESMRALQAEQLQQIEAQQHELQARNQKLGSLREELDQSRADIEALTAEQTERQVQEAAVAASAAQVVAREQALLECRTRIQDLENHLEGRRARWQAVQATCERQTRLLATLEQAARAKEQQLLRQDGEARRMTAQVRILEQRLLDSQRQAEAVSHENQALLGELDARDTQLSTLSETLNATRTDGDSLAATVDQKAAQIEDLQQQLQTMAGELKIARHNLDEAETHAVAQEEFISEERARTAALTGQLETLENELATAHESLSAEDRRMADVDASAAELAAALMAADEELKELRDDRRSLGKELKARDEEITRLDARVTELQAQHVATESEFARQQAMISDLEVELQRKVESLEQVGQGLDRIGELEARIMQLDSMMSRTLDARDDGQDSYGGITRVMVSVGSERAVKYPLFKATMVIGRSADSDIQIRRQYISRHHARLCTEHGDTYIEDLDSKNGVLVNASRITRHLLRNGDLVDLGKMQFKFIDLATHAVEKRSA